MLTCSEVDKNVEEEDGIGEAVEGDPPGGKVVVEKRNSHRENDQVCHQEKQHAQVPVQSKKQQEKNQSFVRLNYLNC